jgi:hypothetical protein
MKKLYERILDRLVNQLRGSWPDAIPLPPQQKRIRRGDGERKKKNAAVIAIEEPLMKAVEESIAASQTTAEAIHPHASSKGVSAGIILVSFALEYHDANISYSFTVLKMLVSSYC